MLFQTPSVVLSISVMYDFTLTDRLNLKHTTYTPIELYKGHLYR